MALLTDTNFLVPYFLSKTISPSLFIYFIIIKATYLNNNYPIALNYNANGNVFVQLPQGPDYDANKIYLYVNIIDNTFGTTVYNLSSPVVVDPDFGLANKLAASLSPNATFDPDSQFLQLMNSGNLNSVAKSVISLSSVFNIQNLKSSSSAINSSLNSSLIDEENNQKSYLREYLIEKVCNLSVSDTSSIKVISSALSSASANPQQLSRTISVRA